MLGDGSNPMTDGGWTMIATPSLSSLFLWGLCLACVLGFVGSVFGRRRGAVRRDDRGLGCLFGFSLRLGESEGFLDVGPGYSQQRPGGPCVYHRREGQAGAVGTDWRVSHLG